MMNFKTLIAFLLLLGMFACTQRTCPTYTKDKIKKAEQTEQADKRV
jgi:hypothetical protein